MTPKLLVITPARDEAANLPRVIDAMAGQNRPPDRWIVVDDGSTDGTAELLEARARDVAFLRVVRAPAFAPAARDRLAVAAEARAFNWALGAAAADERWDLVGKLDADMVLAPEHYARLLEAFAGDPRLGIAGCYFAQAERDGVVRLQGMPEYHVNGALKTYRADCLAAIGGMPERLGWDTLDEIQARRLGWTTRSLRDVQALHLRPSGSAGGVLRGRARHGECAWLVNYPPSVVLAATVRLLAADPPVLSGLAYAAGWTRAAVRRRGRVDDGELLAFARAEQRRRVRAAIRTAIAARSLSAAR